MEKLLLTGFGPYGNTPINPAQQTALALDGAEIGGAAVASRIVPNSFFKSVELVREAIRETSPKMVVMLGEYPGRSMITVERIAQNLNDGTRYGLADNDGAVLQDVLTAPEGPAAYRSTLPIRAMVRAMREAGIPADISDAAGTFVCNHLMYGVLHHLAVEGLSIPAGWLHLPALPAVAALEQNLGMPSMSVETAAAGVRAAIAAAMEHPKDIDAPIRSLLQI